MLNETQSKEIIMQTATQYLAQVQHLLPEAKDPKIVAEVVTFYEAGDSVETCVTALRDYFSRKSILSIAVPAPRTLNKGRPSASLAAARLLRDYGKNRALHMAVQTADKFSADSREFGYWSDVGTTLLEDM